MSILNGIKLKNDETVHQLDYNEGLANKPKIITSWNDLEDKPFYIENIVNELLPIQELTFEGGEHLHEGTLGLVEGETYKVVMDGVEYTCKAEVVEMEGNSLVFIGNRSVFGLGNDTEPFTIGDVNVYNSMMMVVFDEATTHTVRVYQEQEIIHHLDSKLIKDMYYSEGGEEVDILPSQSLVFTYDEEIGGYDYSPSFNLGISIPLVNGEKYNVMWDGTLYECIAESISYGNMQGTAIGNLSNFGGTQGNNEPFIIYYIQESNYTNILLLAGEDTHTVRIYLGGEIVHQIPSKYVNAYTIEEIDAKFNALVNGDEVAY